MARKRSRRRTSEKVFLREEDAYFPSTDRKNTKKRVEVCAYTRTRVNQTCHYRSALRAIDDIYRDNAIEAYKEAEMNRAPARANKRFNNPGYS